MSAAPDPDADRWNMEEVAAYLGVTTGTIASYASRGQMPQPELRIGRSVAWLPATIIKWDSSRPRNRGVPPGAPPAGPAIDGVAITKTNAIASAIRGAIHDGTFPVGSDLPSRRDLCDAYQVAPITVRTAMVRLSAEGLIAIRQGRNGVVISQPDGGRSPWDMSRDELIAEVLHCRKEHTHG